jgi:hypothetical protein
MSGVCSHGSIRSVQAYSSVSAALHVPWPALLSCISHHPIRGSCIALHPPWKACSSKPVAAFHSANRVWLHSAPDSGCRVIWYAFTFFTRMWLPARVQRRQESQERRARKGREAQQGVLCTESSHPLLVSPHPHDSFQLIHRIHPSFDLHTNRSLLPTHSISPLHPPVDTVLTGRTMADSYWMGSTPGLKLEPCTTPSLMPVTLSRPRGLGAKGMPRYNTVCGTSHTRGGGTTRLTGSMWHRMRRCSDGACNEREVGEGERLKAVQQHASHSLRLFCLAAGSSYALHSTAQHSTAQHSTAQHCVPHRPPPARHPPHICTLTHTSLTHAPTAASPPPACRSAASSAG